MHIHAGTGPPPCPIHPCCSSFNPSQDFRNVEDISHVLAELEAMGLLNAGRTIYYKHDAYTYLDIRSANAGQYGLQASLYNSRSLTLAGKLPAPSAGP